MSELSPRSRYEHWTRARLIEECVKLARERDTEREHRQVQQRAAVEARRLHPIGLTELYGTFDRLRPFLKRLAQLKEWAEPGRAQSFDPDSPPVTSSEPDSFLSADGRTTRQGAAVRPEQALIDEMSRGIAALDRRLARRLDPHAEPIPTPSPNQCWKRDCEGRGRRQNWRQRLCGYCGEEFSGQSVATSKAQS